ncbi:NfeD family protein [Leptospira sp. GIMC2001]|uniref:NfeD family protein n=1 Tax=Leptospira sp. GIMC2001 TaxID=1513297 RepID=UPI00234B292A|nr:NfeD family protein [Leptospira sp. GIMC2001]WCL47867.1 NfeD family protein [Leptospira sp. GIMC2001]
MDLLSPEYLPWIWIAAGVLLMVSEFVVPGMFVIFIGFGAIVTGLISLIIPIGMTEKLVILTVTSIVSILVGSAFIKNIFPSTITKNDLIKDDFRNEIVPVISDIMVNQKGGRVKFQGTEWDAMSQTVRIPKGERVRIISRDNLTFYVEQLD